MNCAVKTGLVFSLLSAGSTWSLAAETKAIPAPTNVRGAEYPRILPDLRVEFRIKAPNANKANLTVVSAIRR